MFLENVSNLGDMEAPRYLGLILEKALGISKNYKKALKWNLIAAPTPQIATQSIHPRIDVLLQLRYGLGVEKDIQKAIEWYNVATK